MAGARNPENVYERLDQTLPFVLRQFQKRLRTALPGIVREYDRESNEATVQPAIDVMLTDGSTLPRSPLVRVPVHQPTGGGFVLHFPVAPGDACTLLWNSRSLLHFKRARECAPPAYPDIMPANACVALLGWEPLDLIPAGDAASCVLQHKSGTTYLELTDGNLMLRTPTARVDITPNGLNLQVGADKQVVLTNESLTLQVGADTQVVLTDDQITLAADSITVRTNNYQQETLGS